MMCLQQSSAAPRQEQPDAAREHAQEVSVNSQCYLLNLCPMVLGGMRLPAYEVHE